MPPRRPRFVRASTILRRAHTFLAVGPHRWVKGTLAKFPPSAKGEHKEDFPCQPTACCIVGVVDWVEEQAGRAFRDPLRYVEEILEYRSAADYNDDPDTTYEMVLAVLLKAAALAEEFEADTPEFRRDNTPVRVEL